jgi:hypothetical protein
MAHPLASLQEIDLLSGARFAYWLIDPVLADPAAALEVMEGLEQLPLPIRHPDLPASLLPRLAFDAKADGDSVLRMAQPCFAYAASECRAPWAEGQPRARSLCALVSSSMGPRELAEVLAQGATAVDASGSVRVLRYWDPRVLQHMDREASAPELLPSGFAGAWTYLDSFGRMKQLRRPVENGGRTPLGKPLSPAGQAWLARVSELNALFESTGGGLRVPEDALWAQLESAWLAACQLNLARQDDRLYFASAQFAAGVPLERAPRFQQLVADARQLGVPLRALGAELTEQDWQLIRQQAASPSQAAALHEREKEL